MCGIAGFISGEGVSEPEQLVRRMADALMHRGPDDSGAWVDDDQGIALGHRRLAILDLTQAGHQPMASACGRYVLAFNGEIYNHLEIRKELQGAGEKGKGTRGKGQEERGKEQGARNKGQEEREQGGKSQVTNHQSLVTNHSSPTWRGHSDTETLLAAFAAWGVEKTLKACTGMFAIALWDRKSRTLTLARDRMGEKPLYYGWQGESLLFGSELKALKPHPHFTGDIDRQALTLFLRYNYIPAPHSIYEGIRKLPAGSYIQLPVTSHKGQGTRGKSPVTNHQSPITSHQSPATPIPYWSLREVAERGQVEPFAGSDAEAISLLERTLGGAVAGQQLADVPLGAFLSGGIDSSLTVSLMQARASRPVKTFTIGFEEAGYDEAVHAKAVAAHLGSEHTELYVSPQDAMAVIPQLPQLYDEPFADSSQIPTLLVAQMARQHVTVALSGDGGDELFGGYNRYTWARSIHSKSALLPLPLRHAAGAMLTALSPAAWDRLNTIFGGVLPARYRAVQLGEKIHKTAAVLAADNEAALYRGLVSQWPEPAAIVLGGSEPESMIEPAALADIEQRMMYLDAETYLPDDILCKVDRAAMGVSLETRVPLLDHRVVELAWQLPLSMKIRDGQGKWLLRQLLSRYLPRELIERPKQGFSIPLAEWLRGPLRQWAESLLDESRLRQEGYFAVAPVRQAWEEHLNGKNRQDRLWGILMFQAWLECQGQG